MESSGGQAKAGRQEKLNLMTSGLGIAVPDYDANITAGGVRRCDGRVHRARAA